MGKYKINKSRKPIQIKEVHHLYNKNQNKSIHKIRELLAEAFLEYYCNEQDKCSEPS